MSKRLTRLRALLVRAGFALGHLRRVEGHVVLATMHADGLSGNLEAIRRDLDARAPRVAVTTLARGARRGWRGYIALAIDAVVAGWHLATAAVFVVDDYYVAMYAIRPRAGTTFVQVWHACGALKKFGYSLVDKRYGATEASLEAFPIHTNYDVCLVSAARFAPFYAEAFRQPLDRFTSRLGIPRTDLFFDESRKRDAIAAIRRRYGIPEDRRVILYAPTFRGTRIAQAESPEDLDLATLRRALGDDSVLLLRAHPFVRGRAGLDDSLAGFVVDVSDWPEINELMLVSDVLVTDYSSAIYEFALLERPMAFFAPDLADYEEERGFYFDYRAGVPGPVFETTDELAGFLRAGVFDIERVRRFRAESFDVADGRATERFVDEVVLTALA